MTRTDRTEFDDGRAIVWKVECVPHAFEYCPKAHPERAGQIAMRGHAATVTGTAGALTLTSRVVVALPQEAAIEGAKGLIFNKLWAAACR